MCFFSSSSTPSAPPPVFAPPAPIDTTKDSAESRKARSDEEKRAKLAQGRNSTILTSPLGDTSAASVQKASLLGQTSPA